MTASVSDAGLIAAFAAGDRGAGDAIFARHAAALRAFLTARCRDGDLAAELLQEVALRLVRAAPRLDPGGDVRAYLFQVAANVWRDHVRQEIVRRRAAAPSGDQRFATPADARVLTRDLAAAVRRAVAALPPEQREVVELRHRSGAPLTFRAIAARLHRPLGTVLTQMRAALQKIDAALEEYR